MLLDLSLELLIKMENFSKFKVKKFVFPFLFSDLSLQGASCGLAKNLAQHR